jgi:hypothetical protein
MKTNEAIESIPSLPLPLTKHAEARMNERRLSDEAVNPLNYRRGRHRSTSTTRPSLS